MKIEVWSDFGCPFCYIGKRKLEKALNSFDHKEKIEVIYKSFELNPDAPLIATDYGYEGFAKLKHVSVKQAKEMMDSVALSAKNYGLDYHMDKIQLVSTHKAHQLAKWARTQKKEKALTEVLMHAYFTLGANLAEDKVLLDLVEQVGLDRTAGQLVLEQKTFNGLVDEEISEAQALGIRGVPFFVFDRKYAISGAQPDEQFTQALKKSFAEASSFEQINNDDEHLCGPDGCAV